MKTLLIGIELTILDGERCKCEVMIRDLQKSIEPLTVLEIEQVCSCLAWVHDELLSRRDVAQQIEELTDNDEPGF